MTSSVTKFVIIVAVASLLLLAAGSASAQAPASCPTAPNFASDFTSNQGCLTLNGTNPGFPGFYPAVAPPPAGVTTVLRITPNASQTAGSAWYVTQQPVANAFSTTFTFQLSGTSTFNADGFAFVIQNSAAGTAALGPNGCGIGFGDSASGCVPATGGIPNSLAIEFNTFQNAGVDPNANDVTIQNCTPAGAPTGPNSVDPTCTIAVNSNLSSTLADGNVHTVTITYSGPSTTRLDVILDSNDLFPGGVAFNLATIGLNNANAWVGFTAGTGSGDDNQDILSWTFTPQAQTAVVSGTPAVLSFPNAAGVNVYDYTAQLTAPYPNPVVQVQPILMTQAACDALVQVNFRTARCFVYENAENSGLNAAVMFSVTCPQSPGGTCGSNTDQNFFALLGTDFQLQQSQNPFFVYPGILGLLNPFPGFLKGAGPNSLNPCTPPASGPLFQSNQISSFFIDEATTKGKSGGGASCWVATYDTPGELPPGISISSPGFTTYTLNQSVTANYTCSNPPTTQPATSATGPYLMVATCTQGTGTQASCSTNPNTGAMTCTGTVPTSPRGLHLFEVTSVDSGGNQNANIVIYNVK